MAESVAQTEHGEPSAAPDKVAVNRVSNHGDEESIDHERREFPPLGHGACWDCGRSIHEDHLEQEHCEDAYVVNAIPQEEPLGAEYAKAPNGKLITFQYAETTHRYPPPP